MDTMVLTSVCLPPLRRGLGQTVAGISYERRTSTSLIPTDELIFASGEGF